MDPAIWQTVIALLTALGAFLGALSAIKAKRAETLAIRGKLELEGMQVSVDSLQKSNADLRIDNKQLRGDLADERSAREESDRKLDALYEEFQIYKRTNGEQQRLLRQQIISLGGTPL